MEKIVYVCCKNDFKDKGNYIELKIRQGKYCLIDKTCLYKIKDYKWSLDGAGYAIANVNGVTTRLHPYLLGNRTGMVIDHINGNKLDNRVSNLRHCTQRQNSWNRKDKRGVMYDKNRKKFRAYITVNKIVYTLGRFNTYQEALRERKIAELTYYGKFAI